MGWHRSKEYFLLYTWKYSYLSPQSPYWRGDDIMKDKEIGNIEQEEYIKEFFDEKLGWLS